MINGSSVICRKSNIAEWGCHMLPRSPFGSSLVTPDGGNDFLRSSMSEFRLPLFFGKRNSHPSAFLGFATPRTRLFVPLLHYGLPVPKSATNDDGYAYAVRNDDCLDDVNRTFFPLPVVADDTRFASPMSTPRRRRRRRQRWLRRVTDASDSPGSHPLSVGQRW